MVEFNYIIDKINSSEFQEFPFKHIVLDDFLSKEHFDIITNCPEINLGISTSTSKLIQDIIKQGYNVQGFPGCTTNINKYLTSYETKNFNVDNKLLGGFGMVFRLTTYKSSLLQKLVAFLNGPEFKKCLEQKFNITNPTSVETGIQKYLDMYEISPHPDIRKKEATYMLNINPSSESEDMDIHTYLCSFKKDKEWIYDFWKTNTNIDRCWVPWNWCNLETTTNKNNSIILFKPSNDTLHAVRLNYNHLITQRTQVYGNLWSTLTQQVQPSNYKHLENKQS
jgi:hypothetical protein